MTKKGVATQQHAKTHSVTIGEGQLDGPLVIAQADLGHYHIALLPVTSRVGDLTMVVDGCLADCLHLHLALHGMDPEPDPASAVAAERPDLEGMEGRGPGPCVHLDLHRRQGQPRQGHPLPPTYGEYGTCPILTCLLEEGDRC